MNIYLENVHRVYPGTIIIGVNEWFKMGNGWTTLMPDGVRCTDNDKYVEDVIKEIYAAGGTSVNICLKNTKTGKVVDQTDFRLTEILQP